MNASQIAAMLEALHKEYQAGDISVWNYKGPLEKLFELSVALANRVALLETKENVK